jgi:hypothetical protein
VLPNKQKKLERRQSRTSYGAIRQNRGKTDRSPSQRCAAPMGEIGQRFSCISARDVRQRHMVTSIVSRGVV